MLKKVVFILTLLLILPVQVQAHFGTEDDKIMVAGAQIDKTLLLGGLILVFIVLTVVFQLIRRKR